MAGADRGTSTRARGAPISTNMLVERPGADGTQNPDREETNPKGIADRSVANIHTGSRAVYEAVHSNTPVGSMATPHEVVSSDLHGSGGGVSAQAPVPSGQITQASSSSASGAGEHSGTPEAMQGGGSALAHNARADGNQHVTGAPGIPSVQRGLVSETAAHPAGGGGGGGGGSSANGNANVSSSGDGLRDHLASHQPGEGTPIAPHMLDPGPAVNSPTLTISAAAGAENSAIPIGIGAGLVDAGRDETLTITVAGLPVGAMLSAGVHNADGSWTLTDDQFAGLTVMPAQNSGEDFTLSITATAHDATTGVEAHAMAYLPVTVIDTVPIITPAPIPPVTAPSLSISAAVGAEDSAIPIAIAAGLTDVGRPETLSVTITGLPDGATLSAGAHNSDGTWTLTGDQLAGLTVMPSPNSGEDFTLSITATAHDNATGVEAHASAQLPITVIDTVAPVTPLPIPAVTAPSLAISAAVGAENASIPLAINAGLADLGSRETLSISISGLPDGATLSAGVHNSDRTWTLTGDQLAGLTLTPAQNSGADFTLAITATAHDTVTGVEAHAAAQLPVTVIDAVPTVTPTPIPSVTAPNLAVSAAVGAENVSIPLAINVGLIDVSNTEALSVSISGLPDGATLSAGMHNPDGTWTLTGDQLAGLTLTPASNSGEDFTLAITATAHDITTGVEAHAAAQLPVTVIDTLPIVNPTPIPSVTAPTIAVSAAVGAENAVVPLAINAGLIDVSNTEALSVSISGLPVGATLSAGMHNPDGTWTLTGDQLAGLTLTPAPNSGEDFTLEITATAHDTITGVEAHATAQLPVTMIDTVAPVVALPIPAVTAPTIAVSAAVGVENTVIPLVINAGLIDVSNTEMLSVSIAGLPEGATLSAGAHNSDGTWTLTGDQLAGLTLTPTQNSGEDFTLAITATAHDNVTGVEAHASAQLPVTVIDTLAPVTPLPIPAVTAPSLAISSAVGTENTSIPLVINAGLADLGAGETLSISINGLPNGATLSAGMHNPDGTWTLTGEQLAGLTLAPAQGSGEDFTLRITATAHDTATGVEAHATAQLPVTVIDTVEAVAPPPIPSVTAPLLSISAAVGVEDGTIPIAIAAGLADVGQSETLSVSIAGLPDGATLSAGVHNADGTWTLTGDQLAGLTLTPAPNSGEDFTLAITATAHDNATGVEAHASAQLPVTVIDTVALVTPLPIPAVTAPSLAISAAVGAENASIPLAINAGLVDVSNTETLSVSISGLPDGATLSAGMHNPDGTWTLMGDQLAGLTLTPAENSGEDFTLAITATAHDNATGVEAHASAQLPVTVIDTVALVVALPILAVTAPNLSVSAAFGTENGTIPIAIAAGLTDIGQSETLAVSISGLPEGATLSAGVHHTDGSWTLTGDQLAGLTLTPAQNSGEDFTLSITATAHDTTTGVEAHATAQLPVTVIDTVAIVAPTPIPAGLAPSLAISAAVGAENASIPLTINAGLTDIGQSETLNVTVSGLPDGATLSAGVYNSDGTWTLTGDQLAGLTLTPAQNSGEDFTLAITATAHDTITGVEAHASAQLPVTVIDIVPIVVSTPIPPVTAPSLAVSATVGVENTSIPLVINVGLVDVSNTETLSVSIAGLPDGATLSAGVHNTDGSWTLTGDQLAGLTLTPAQNSGEDFTLCITATAHDNATGVEAHASAQVPVTVIDTVAPVTPLPIPAVTAPSLSVSAAVGVEDGAIPITIAAGLTDIGQLETLTVSISGLPEGATLSAGVHHTDGSWTLTGDQLAGLTLTPATNSGEDFTLAITATAHDAITGVEAHAAAQLPVTVIDTVAPLAPLAIPVVTAPTIAISAAVGTENTAIPLAINAGLIDVSNTEALSMSIAGLPEGATLSAGVHNSDGTWTLTGDQLAGLTLTPAQNSGEDFTLSVTATAQDIITGVEAHATAQLPVTVIDTVEPVTALPIPAVTAPSLSISAAVGVENGAIPIAIAAGLTDAGRSETLTVTVTSLPDGATLSAGVHNTDGSWTLTGDQLAGLTLTPAANSGEDFTLAITATAHDNVTGVEAHASAQLPVTVIDTVAPVVALPIPAVTAPTIAVSAAVGTENTSIPLAINSGLIDVSNTETLSVSIAGLPDGAMLSAGVHNTDGSWTLTGDQLAGLTLTPAQNSGEDFTLSVTATAHDTITGVEAHASAQLPVTVIDTVAPVAPLPISAVTDPSPVVSEVSATAQQPVAVIGDLAAPVASELPLGAVVSGLMVGAAGTGNLSIPLDIHPVFSGGTDSVVVAIGNMPDGATLSTGAAAPDGDWIVPADQLAGLTLTLPSDVSGSVTLSVTPITVGADEVAQVGTSVPLVIDAGAIAPSAITSVGAVETATVVDPVALVATLVAFPPDISGAVATVNHTDGSTTVDVGHIVSDTSSTPSLAVETATDGSVVHSVSDVGITATSPVVETTSVTTDGSTTTDIAHTVVSDASPTPSLTVDTSADSSVAHPASDVGVTATFPVVETTSIATDGSVTTDVGHIVVSDTSSTSSLAVNTATDGSAAHSVNDVSVTTTSSTVETTTSTQADAIGSSASDASSVNSGTLSLSEPAVVQASVVADAPSIVPAVDSHVAANSSVAASATSSALTNMSDTQFLQAIEQLGSSVADTGSAVNHLLDPVAVGSASQSGMGHDVGASLAGTADASVAHDAAVAPVAAETHPAPAPEPVAVTTMAFVTHF
jgi:hypothetical protein